MPIPLPPKTSSLLGFPSCPPPPTSYCLTIVSTSSRLSTHYLKKTLSSLTGLSPPCPSISLTINLRLPSPTYTHPTLTQLNSSGYTLNLHYSTPNSPSPPKSLNPLLGTKKTSEQWIKYENEDYVRALQGCQKEGKDYCIVVEEDVWATSDFWNKLSSAVTELNTNSRSWSCLKLFVTDYWSGWEKEVKDYVVLGLGGGVAAVLGEGVIWAGVVWGLRGRWGRWMDWKKMLLRVYLIGIGVGSMVVLGKQGMAMTSISRTGVYQHDMGASSLGIVYPLEVLDDLIPFLKDGMRRKMEDKSYGKKAQKNIPIDLLLQEFHNTPEAAKGRKQYIVVPSLLEHTGEFSSSSYKVRGRGGMTEQEYYQKYMKLAARFDDLSVEELWELVEFNNNST
ncbi:hypothetical protein TrVE_jg7059 [Triparma verrucosa]|uniref:Uncharacterized protein n=1 Tax=Triparma verrucosa TaxID=1606542 RepID=A0A9W7BGH2_9STRA|nr:hypothetical protein TrVE_jg7059 [Triparma verrucosa]